jgi:hypothetical protein
MPTSESSMLLISHEDRMQALEKVAAGLREHRVAMDAALARISGQLGTFGGDMLRQVGALELKVDSLSQRVHELGQSWDDAVGRLTALEVTHHGDRVRARKIKKAITGVIVAAITSAFASAGAWAAGLMKGWIR